MDDPASQLAAINSLLNGEVSITGATLIESCIGLRDVVMVTSLAYVFQGNTTPMLL